MFSWGTESKSASQGPQGSVPVKWDLCIITILTFKKMFFSLIIMNSELDGIISRCFKWGSVKNKQWVEFSPSAVFDFVTLWTAARQASLSITNSWNLFKLMSIKLVMPSNHLILCCPLLLPSIFPSLRVFFNESALQIMWPKYWSFSISPSNEHSGLISFRTKKRLGGKEICWWR